MKLLLVLFGSFILFGINAENIDNDSVAKERAKESALRFFETNEVLNLVLTADFSNIRQSRDRANSEYHEAELIYNNGDGEKSLPVKIKTRGNFRLKCENCDFPPLRLNFKKKETISTVFEGQDKLKLVTHCQDTSEVMQKCVLREYLAYRMYNVICENSLRVRLVRMTYIDTNSNDSLTRFSFFIEDKEMMAKRLGKERLKMANLRQNQVLQDNIIKLTLFNYLIGNTDWSVPKLHNVTLLRAGRHEPPVVVPFDFDMSEFVNAPYMQMYMGQELIENRYKGKVVPKDALVRVIGHYKNCHADLIDLILDFEYLDVKCKQKCVAIIEDFYKIISDKHSSYKTFLAEAGR